MRMRSYLPSVVTLIGVLSILSIPHIDALSGDLVTRTAHLQKELSTLLLQDYGSLKLSGQFRAGTQGVKHTTIRPATLHDVPRLVSWFQYPSDDTKSNLKAYSQSEIEGYILDENLYLAENEEDFSLLGTLALSCPTGPDRTELLVNTAGFPSHIVNDFPDLVFYFGALKMQPEFIKSPGKISNKACLSMGMQFVVEIARHAIRLKTSNQHITHFAVCAGTSLNCLSTMHLAPVLRDSLFRAKDLTPRRTLIQEHDIPGSQNKRGLLTVCVGERNPFWQEDDGIKEQSVNTIMGSMNQVWQQAAELELSSQQRQLLDDLAEKKVTTRWLSPTTMVHGLLRPGLCDIVPRDYQQAQDVTQSLYQARLLDQVGIVSTGKRWGADRAHAVPTLRLNLGELQNIPLLDLSNGLVVVEPGVTQGQVADLLQGTGWTLPVTGSCRHASIIGNAVDGGLTSAGLRINQVIGIEAVEFSSGKKISTGVLASSWSGHGHGLYGGVAATDFLFGQRGVVLRMALALQKLPRHLAVGLVPGTNDALRCASQLFRQGQLAWWQLRVDEQAGAVVAVKSEGHQAAATQAEIEHFFAQLGHRGQFMCGDTSLDDLSQIQVEGTGPFPDFFVKAGFDYFRGQPSCDRHHHVLGTTSCSEAPSDGRGFRLAAYAAPMNPSIIAVLREEILKAGAAASGDRDAPNSRVSVTLTVTPMSRSTMYFLVWATFDRTLGADTSELFFRSVEKIMTAARCPPCRYG